MENNATQLEPARGVSLLQVACAIAAAFAAYGIVIVLLHGAGVIR